MAEKWNNWDVAEDGLLSRGGTSEWPVYEASGQLSRPTAYASWYLRDREAGIIECVKRSL